MSQLFSGLLEPLPRSLRAVQEAAELSPGALPPLLVGAPTAFSRGGEKPRTTLIPLREANDSWPGLRAMISPSTNRLTGRLTRRPSL